MATSYPQLVRKAKAEETVYVDPKEEFLRQMKEVYKERPAVLAKLSTTLPEIPVLRGIELFEIQDKHTAELMKVEPATIYNWKSGKSKTTIKQLERLCYFLEYLCRGESGKRGDSYTVQDLGEILIDAGEPELAREDTLKEVKFRLELAEFYLEQQQDIIKRLELEKLQKQKVKEERNYGVRKLKRQAEKKQNA